MSSYATNADFEAYVEGWVTDDANALDRLLERATLDVDELLGPIPPRASSPNQGLKLNPPTDLTPIAAAALRDGVCEQALHRFKFVEPAGLAAQQNPAGALTTVKGPDFEVTYSPGQNPVTGAGGLYAPALGRILRPLAYLQVRGARARA
jgi:hypothetical protein